MHIGNLAVLPVMPYMPFVKALQLPSYSLERGCRGGMSQGLKMIVIFKIKLSVELIQIRFITCFLLVCTPFFLKFFAVNHPKHPKVD